MLFAFQVDQVLGKVEKFCTQYIGVTGMLKRCIHTTIPYYCHTNPVICDNIAIGTNPKLAINGEYRPYCHECLSL